MADLELSCRRYAGLIISLIWAVVLFFFIWRNKWRAYRGDSNAARFSILSMYAKVIYVGSIFQIGRGVAFLYLIPGEETYDFVVKHNFYNSFLMALVIAGLRSGLTLGVLFYLTSASSGKRVILKSFRISFVFCIVTTLLIAFSFYKGPVDSTNESLYLSTTFDLFHFAMYIYFTCKIYFSPMERLFYNGGRIRVLLASRIICIFIFLTGDIIFLAGGPQHTAYMTYAFGDYWSFTTEPFFLMAVLIEDSQYWRFLGSNLASSGSSKHFPVQRFIQDHIISVSHERLVFTALECLGVDIIDFTRVQFKSVLGKGSHGTVRKVCVNGIGEIACKEVYFNDDNLTPWEIEVFCREALVSRNFDHENIVKFYGICVHPPCLYLLYEICSGGNLRDYIFSREVDPEIRFDFVRQATRALDYIHKKEYIHRDIKTENYLLHRRSGSQHYTLKLADFGTTRQQQLDQQGNPQKMRVFTGTLLYMAPELLKHFPKSMRARDMDKSLRVCYDYKADIFSLAVTIWEIISQTSAYHTETFENGRDFRQVIIELERRPCLKLWSGSLWEVLLQQNFKTSPVERLDTKTLMGYLMKHQDQLTSELQERTLLEQDAKKKSDLETRSKKISVKRG